MKTLGIIGGIGPESTIEYYRLLIDTFQERTRDGSYPHVIVNSIDLKRMIDWFTKGELSEVVEYLTGELQRLARAGADFALLSANTPHAVFDALSTRSPIPLLSIVEATCAEAKLRGLKKLALFGTRFTMQGRFYPEVFTREGVALVVPDEEEQAFIHERYMNELLKGVFLEETRERLVAIAGRLKESEGVEGLILGGTELPLILRGESAAGLPLLDTTRIHVNAAVAQLLS
ncbi:MAG TPA: amino acid racemase [Pyrinomonadaceae bacterium]|nr:amino acid racemase [Pyrinomonadaceae bacterium]